MLHGTGYQTPSSRTAKQVTLASRIWKGAAAAAASVFARDEVKALASTLWPSPAGSSPVDVEVTTASKQMQRNGYPTAGCSPPAPINGDQSPRKDRPVVPECFESASAELNNNNNNLGLTSN
ncbi:hypothetical protein PVAP13_9KG639250 [Panicum virgatum]|uniref:Uncharacterized protein n=1 Tax=Panicum virgatum TaxID=38727 RepID=A0A8T0NWP9_PANVG|nr:hypothetical protein PVAP13_9KG639250 [Panicum virgatum]